MTGLKEDIIRLDIAMEDMDVIERAEGIDKLLEDLECLLFGEVPLGSDIVLESAAFAVLIDQVDVLVGLDHLDKLDDVEVVLEQLEGV